MPRRDGLGHLVFSGDGDHERQPNPKSTPQVSVRNYRRPGRRLTYWSGALILRF